MYKRQDVTGDNGGDTAADGGVTVPEMDKNPAGPAGFYVAKDCLLYTSSGGKALGLLRPDGSYRSAQRGSCLLYTSAAVFYRLYDSEYPAFERRMSNNTFDDVKTGRWFYKEVETLYNIGIVEDVYKRQTPDRTIL